MDSNPLSLAVRFALELSALVALGVWAWRHGDGWTAAALAVGLPLVAALVWGTFAVAGDPSRSGRAPVAVPGIVRLGLELGVFASSSGSATEQSRGLCNPFRNRFLGTR